MTEKLTLGSLFDGIGGFPLAAALSGITPVWAAEINPACVAVTRRHFPDMLHFGDVSEIDGAKIPPVDIITFGSPCQDLSVAGKRAGLDGARSGLFTEAIRIIYEMREATHGVYPTFLVWENVPGAFSSGNGRDFQTVLREITKTDIPMPASGRWANAGVVRSGGICVAWRVLDAQYWDVPQRRKRIYLVGSFGDRSAEQILFKPDRVRRYLAPREAAGEGAAADSAGSACVSRTVFDARGNGDGRTAPTVTGDHNGRVSDYTAVCVFDKAQITSPQNRTRAVPNDKSCAVTAQGDIVGVFKAGNGAKAGGIGYSQDVTPALTAAGSGTNQAPSVVYALQGSMVGREEQNGPQGNGVNENVCLTMNTADRHSVVYAIGNGQKNNTTISDKAGALTCMHDQQTVVYAIDRVAFNQGENAKYDFEVSDSGVNSTITARGPSAVSYEEQPTKWIARRLTPLECERLQGYPDGWTVLPKIKTISEADYELFLRAYLLDKRLKGQTVKKTPTREQMVRWYNRLDSDSTRYRQLGNSLAIPCALRVIDGIAEHIRQTRHEMKGEGST